MHSVLVATLLGIAAFFVLLTCFTYTLFWISAGRSRYGRYLEERSGGRVPLWVLRGVLTSVLSLFLVVLSTPLRFYLSLWHPKPESSCPFPAIVLVHGVYHNTSAWLLYRIWLKRAGFSNVYTYGYSSLGKTFEEILGELTLFVDEARRGLGGRPVILIGHSLGGLLCRCYAARNASGGKIAAAVTLGTPHQGSRLAALGLGGLARSLGYRGELITRIEREVQPTDFPCLAVYSPIDNMVLPSESLHIALQGWKCYETSPVSHLALLYHPATARKIIQFLLDTCQDSRTGSDAQFRIGGSSKSEKIG